MTAYHRHEDQLQMLKTGFIRCFFSLIIRFLFYLRVELGFDYLFGPGGLYNLLRPYFNRAVHEFRNVIDNDARLVISRVFLRQQKRFTESAVRIKIAEIWMGAYSILAFTAENNPTAVTGPAVVTFRPAAVN